MPGIWKVLAGRTMRKGTGRFGPAAVLILALVGAAPVARADGWSEVAGLQVARADATLPLARIFDSPDFRHQLVVLNEESPALVLDLKAQSVSSLAASAIAWTDGDLPVPDLGQAVEVGTFLNDDGILGFELAEESYLVRPEPPLVGVITLEKLRAAKPDYVHAAQKFVPDESAVAAIAKVRTPTVVRVFFGTWCSYCKHWLPHLMKTVESAKNPAFTIELVGMSEDQSEPADLLRAHDISLTPTFVVLQGDEELGRIEEEPLVSIEADLARILGAKP